MKSDLGLIDDRYDVAAPGIGRRLRELIEELELLFAKITQTSQLEAALGITDFTSTLLDDTTAAEARTTLDAMEDVLTTIGDTIVATTAGAAARLAAAASVAAHATTMNPWAAREVTLTGGAVTFTDIADAPYVGAVVWIKQNAAHVWTNGAVFNVQGGANYTAAADDWIRVYAVTVSTFDVTVFQEAGAVIGPASATDGNLVVFNGTTGKLVKDGGAPGSGGITELVAATNFPSANSVDITSIPQTYAALLLVITGLSFDTATRALRMRISSDNGSTVNTGGMHGTFVNNAVNSSAGGGNSPVATATQTAAQVTTTLVVITGYQSGSFTNFICAGLDQDSVSHSSNVTYIGDTNAINCLRMLMNSTGNFDAGTYALYGVK